MNQEFLRQTQLVKLEFVPTLEKLLEVYRVPRGQERFDAYIAATVGKADRTADLSLPPLVSANPMAKEHVNLALETWLALDVEAATREVLLELESVFTNQVSYKVGLTLLDDQKGGWTNRYLNDFGFRFPEKLLQDWLVVPLWVSDSPNLETMRLEVRAVVARAVWQLEHGLAKTLLEQLQQERFALQFAGVKQTLTLDDLEYSQTVIQPFLTSLEKPVQFACLYGDTAAREVGYEAKGLSDFAGLETAMVGLWGQN